jgi:hypothetical protein
MAGIKLGFKGIPYVMVDFFVYTVVSQDCFFD